MAQYYPPRQQMDQRALLQLLLLMAAQQQQQQGGQARGGNEPSGIQQFLDYVKKAKSTYEDGRTLYDAGASAYNYFFPTYNAATQAAWNAGAGEAAQAAWNAGANTAWNSGEAANAAWNAGADAASGVTQGSGSTASGFAEYAPWLAVAASALNSGQALLNKNATDEQKAYEGAMAVPRAVAAYYTLGLSTLGEGLARKQWGGTMKKVDKFLMNNPLSPVAGFMLASKLWTSDKWKTEGKRLKGLQKKGIEIPDFLTLPMQLKQGRRKEQLVNPYLPKDFIGKDPKYGWTNNKFAESRNVADLRPEDIWGYSAFFDRYGNDWLKKFSEQQRRDIAQSALNRGAVKEHHGTIDIDWTPELQGDTSNILGSNYKKPTVIPLANNPAPPQQNRPLTPLPINGNMDPFNKNTNPSPQLPPPGQYTRVSPGVYLDSNGRTVLQHQRKLK